MLEVLVQRAVAMLERAYCPYSHFAVGAALLCADGSIFTGCNVENAAYSSAICAERAAAVQAVCAGHRDFVRLVIASSGADYCVPCGECRQVLAEFAPDMEIICLNGQREAVAFPLRELLPHSFAAKELRGEDRGSV